MAIESHWRRGWGWSWGAWRGVWPALQATRAHDQADERRGQPYPSMDTRTHTRGASGAAGSEPDAAFEAFFREHERAIYAFLWRMSGDPQAARDLTQETFLRAWRHFEQVRGYEQPRAWLLRVAANLARSSHRRDRSLALSAETLTEAQSPAHSDPTQRLAERDLVQRTLLALPPNQRAALTLREVYG
ncbi:MAG: RNA polymerase sigma factor, partial [Ktedonobacterales bacterium]